MSYERLVPGTLEWDLYFANHQSRYAFALSQLEKGSFKKVLDAATGVGYGAHYLAQSELYSITAIDRNEAALSLASKKFASKQIQFIKDDCETFEHTQSSFPFDAVVSFETLEHLPNPKKFVANCYKALQQNGLLIISTPNQLVSSPDGIKDWEYHEKEYTPTELINILEEQGFKEIQIYGQQLTPIGLLRQQMRAELNRLHSNPFIRLGKWIQSILRGRKFKSILPEQPEDFEIVLYPDHNKIATLGTKGPFVLIAVCKK